MRRSSGLRHTVPGIRAMTEPAQDLEQQLRSEIRELGLVAYASELDERGYTVIPPEIAAPN